MGAPRGARAWPAAAAGLGLLAALYEIWMTFVWGPTAIAPIRVDVFLIAPILAAVYLICAWQVWRLGWKRSAALAGGLSLAASAGMASVWVDMGQQVAQLDANNEERNRMLFEAKFRNREAYANAFGMNEAMADVPAGHWAAEAQSAPTRLIVSPAGHAYLFYSWGPTEFQFGPGAPLRAAAGEGSPGWEALLVMRGVGERRLAVAPPEGDALIVHIDGAPAHFRRAPPPLLDIHEDERLAYLGTYSAAERLRQHARVSQLWLWQSDEALLAVGIFRFLVPGQRADFVTPAVLGRGQPEDGGWRFRWNDRGRPREAILRVTEAGVEIQLPGWKRGWTAHTLAPEAIFRDEVIELAPLASPEAWEHWFDVQLVVHFSSGEIPAL